MSKLELYENVNEALHTSKQNKTDIQDLKKVIPVDNLRLKHVENTGSIYLMKVLPDGTEDVISTIDLPLEQIIKSARYNRDAKALELVIDENNIISVPLNDLGTIYKADEKTLTLTEDNVFQLSEYLKSTISTAVQPSALSKYLTKIDAAENYASYMLMNRKQDKLVSGTNIKTINGYSILGKGNLVIAGTGTGSSGGGSTNSSEQLLGSSNDAAWYRLAQIDNPNMPASGTFIVDYFEDSTLINSTTFRINVAVTNGQIFAEVCPLIRMPNEFDITTDALGSSTLQDAGLASLRIEHSDEGVYVVGLINCINPFPAKEIKIDVAIENGYNINIIKYERVAYALDNEDITLTNGLDLGSMSPGTAMSFNIEMDTTCISSVLNSGGGTYTGIDLDDTHIFGILYSNPSTYNTEWYVLGETVEYTNGELPFTLITNNKEYDLPQTIRNESLLNILSEQHLSSHKLPNIKVSYKYLYGAIKIEVSTGSVNLAINRRDNYNITQTINSNETYTTENVAFYEYDTIDIQGGGHWKVSFIPYISTGELPTIPKLQLKISGRLPKVLPEGIVSDTLNGGTGQAATTTYTYGIDADLKGFDLYDLSDRIENVEETVDRNEVLRNINFETPQHGELETFMYKLADLYYKGEVEDNKIYVVNGLYIANVTFIGAGCLVRLTDLRNHYFIDSADPINQVTDINSITCRYTYYQQQLTAGEGISIENNVISAGGGKIKEELIWDYYAEDGETIVDGRDQPHYIIGYLDQGLIDAHSPFKVVIEVKDHEGEGIEFRFLPYIENGGLYCKFSMTNSGGDMLDVVDIENYLGAYLFSNNNQWYFTINFYNLLNDFNIYWSEQEPENLQMYVVGKMYDYELDFTTDDLICEL